MPGTGSGPKNNVGGGSGVINGSNTIINVLCGSS